MFLLFYVIHQWNLYISHLDSCVVVSPKNILVNFFTAIEGAYGTYPSIQYHNNQHAADVLHSVHVLLDSSALLDTFSDVEVCGAITISGIQTSPSPLIV